MPASAHAEPGGSRARHLSDTVVGRYEQGDGGIRHAETRRQHRRMRQHEPQAFFIRRRERRRRLEDGIRLVLPTQEPDGRSQQVARRRVGTDVPRTRGEACGPGHVPRAVGLMGRLQEQIGVRLASLELPGRDADEIDPAPHPCRVGRRKVASDRGGEEWPRRRPDHVRVKRVAEPHLAPPTVLAEDQQTTAFECNQRLGTHQLLRHTQAQRLGVGHDLERAALVVIEAHDTRPDQLDHTCRGTELADQRPRAVALLDGSGIEAGKTQLARDEWVPVGPVDDRRGRTPSMGPPRTCAATSSIEGGRADRPRRARPGPPSTG